MVFRMLSLVNFVFLAGLIILAAVDWWSMSGTRSSTLVRRVLDFWFDGELVLAKPLDPKFMKMWFGADPAVDADIKERFLDDLELVSTNAGGAFDALTLDSHSALAGVILLDQFSRNMFRDTPRMFATDPLALSLSRKAIKAGFDAQIAHPMMRAFFYLPLLHAEDLAAQDEGMLHHQRAYDSEPEDSLYKSNLAESIDYMRRHRDIIAKFGHFPHRNTILGRTSTAEEIAFIQGGGDTFDPRKKNASKQ